MYDLHGARHMARLPPDLRAALRALYAASEVHTTAEVTAEHNGRGFLRVVLCLMRVVWRAGIVAGRAQSMITAAEPDRRKRRGIGGERIKVSR